MLKELIFWVAATESVIKIFSFRIIFTFYYIGSAIFNYRFGFGYSKKLLENKFFKNTIITLN